MLRRSPWISVAIVIVAMDQLQAQKVIRTQAET
jgi:hypothetical protein